MIRPGHPIVRPSTRALARGVAVLIALVLAAPLALAQPSPATPPAGAGAGSGATPSPAPSAAPSAAPPGNSVLQWQGRPIEHVQFRGNRKVEDDAIRVQLLSKPGTLLDATKLRQDIRSMWRMGFFADIDVEGKIGTSGGITLTFAVKEKPSIRKVLIEGNKELGLDKINEVLDLELDSIVDVTKVKKNRDKIADLYVQKGFYLATVDYEIKPVNEAEVDVWFKIDEKAKVKIREIQFIGNNHIPDKELRAAIATRRADALSFLNDSGTYNQEAFERDLLLISAHYWDRGYANVKVGTPELRLSRDKQYMYLSIPIDEGPIFTIGAVKFKGDLIGSAAQNLAKLKIRPGMKFSRTLIAVDREKLSAFYQDQGYAYANVMPLTKVDLDKKTIALTFEISRGKRAYFERINIRGNTKTRDKVIRREMKISEGELFNNTNLEVSKQRIMALGFFENVVISTKRGSSDEFVVVNVEVTERPTGTFQIGAGFSSVENFIAQAQISQNNLFGRGQTLALQAQLSSLRQLFLLRFVEPYFLDTHWTFAFDLYNQSTYFYTGVAGASAFARNAYGGTLTWGYPLLFEASVRDVRAFLTYKLENVSITTGNLGLSQFGASSSPLAAQQVANLFRGGVTSSLQASISWDSRNDRIYATKGWYDTISAEYASQYTGSQNKFLRLGATIRHYHPIWGPFVYKGRLEAGLTTSTDPLGVPISERYLLGGIYNVRGYAPLSLGPRLLVAQPGDVGQPLGQLPLGGNLQLYMNNEIEFPLFKKVGISGVVFFDLGNAYNLENRYCSNQRRESTISIKFDPCFRFPESLTSGLRYSVGFGFRWISPIGPLRFEWGIPLDAQPGEDPLVFEFTIGNFF